MLKYVFTIEFSGLFGSVLPISIVLGQSSESHSHVQYEFPGYKLWMSFTVIFCHNISCCYITIAGSVPYLIGCHLVTSFYRFIKEQIKPKVTTEQQFLFVCHMLGPFLPRFQQERSYSCIEVRFYLILRPYGTVYR